MGSASIHGPLWGSRARDWAEYGEGTSNDLFSAVLNKMQTKGRLLDIGCGAGKFCKMASVGGLEVKGFDASETLIEIARQRLPNAEFKTGEMEELPYADKSFDFVTGLNSFQYAADIVNAMREAKRVTKPGGRIILAVWGKPENCDATVMFSALAPFMPPPPTERAVDKKPLYAEGVLEDLARKADLKPESVEEIKCLWNFEDTETALRGMLSAGPISMAIKNYGEEKVGTAAKKVLKQFTRPSGKVIMKNTFLCLTAGV